MSLMAIAAKRGHEPLMGHLPVVRCLVEAGANLETRDNDGQTPLAHAARTGQHEVVEFLLSRGADPNAGSYSGTAPPISEATHHGNLECVRCLVNADGVMDSLPRLDETIHPLVCAARSRHPAVVDLLLAQPQGYAQLGTNLRAMLCVAAARGDLAAV
ncbi:ankyrin [Aspergillus violaceofuscus CBS 115571]|uniref:Ankyrin n=1 Tax=Aspergillus violaceofuscus (strain CBS 115571) TaxID=1450538 RepID=A0A2V5H741_ASPV1|nr:ankyrin [Aspergillus violaceofuscus CBS 115571]